MKIKINKISQNEVQVNMFSSTSNLYLVQNVSILFAEGDTPTMLKAPKLKSGGPTLAGVVSW